MQPNRVKAALRRQQTVFGPMITEARAVGTINVLGVAGYDFVFLDSEHAMLSTETKADLVQMALACNICSLVRVTDLAYPLVARALDAGVQGVIIPRVATRDQADAAVSVAKHLAIRAATRRRRKRVPGTAGVRPGRETSAHWRYGDDAVEPARRRVARA